MDNINSLEDMTHICRVCLEKSPKMYPLVGPILNVDVNVATMITYCTSIEVALDADLPKGVCIPCFRTIRIAYNFISEFKDVNEKLLGLREMLKQIKEENDRKSESDVTVSCAEGKVQDYKGALTQTEDELNDDDEKEEDDVGDSEQIIIKYVDNTLINSSDICKSSNTIKLKQHNKIQTQADKRVYYRPLRKKAVIKTYMCPICTKTFMKFEAGLVLHLYSHEGAQVKCNKCALDTVFSLEDYVDHYKKTHLYQCHICNRSFSKKSTQYYHLRVHDESRIYECSFENCKKSFLTSWSLKKHQNTHSESVKYICSKCGRKFNTYDTFRYHQKTHDGTRNHLCLECGRAFLQAVHLKYHMWRHTGIKRFRCDKCGKRYTSVTQLKKHWRKYCGADEADLPRT